VNVILIISDTVRQDYCGCYGSTWVQTPNIDALSRGAAVMDGFYAASFPTGPMRKDVHSGRFTFPYANWGQPRPEGERVLAEEIRAAGHTTAYVGDTANSPQYRHGFEYEQIISAEASRLHEVPTKVELPAASRKLRIPLARIQEVVRNAMGWDGEADRRAARTMLAAHRWLEEQRTRSTPFFLMVDTFDPHEPWDPPRYYIDHYDPGYAGDELMEPAYEPAGYATEREIAHMRCMYAAKLTMVDRWIGYLIDGVKRMGLEDTTAVIFTSDHGFYHGEHGLIGKVRLDRRGGICGRWPLYEAISHAPLLVKVPGIAGGRRHRTLCQPPDIMPTVLDLMDVQVPSEVQGVSLLPVIRGKRHAVRDVAISSSTHVTDARVRCPSCFRTSDYLYVYGGDEWPSELYDLAADPGESRNIIRGARTAARRLHREYLEFLRSIDCPEPSLESRREFSPTPRLRLPHRKLI